MSQSELPQGRGLHQKINSADPLEHKRDALYRYMACKIPAAGAVKAN